MRPRGRMRIGIDAHAIGSQTAGNETYIKNLIEALAAIDEENEYVLFFTRPEVAEQWRDRFRNFRVWVVRPHTRYLRIPFSLPWAVWRAQVDLLHVQYAAPPICPRPIVTTIHDLSFEHLPQFYTPRERWLLKLAVGYTARRAARILTVSEYSARDIRATYRVPPERIVVTPEGVSALFVPVRDQERIHAVRRRYGIARAYILSVGSLQPRKNLVRLIRAYVNVRRRDDELDHQLVIVGKKGWLYQDIFRAAQHAPFAEDIIFTGYVPEEDLPALYSGATVFVYPSIFEGFGLPVLEAMACGVPVITSYSSSLPEVVGEAALLVNPYDERAIEEALQQVIWNDAMRRELSERGLRRAQQFSWKRTAELTLRAYEDVVRNVRQSGRAASAQAAGASR
ncbi:D-inositol 3-phosphate glycosyltransferase [bacterium HR10]|nr:D-inositol 3-phosphate glycosyltransferase [bacterium HR10]